MNSSWTSSTVPLRLPNDGALPLPLCSPPVALSPSSAQHAHICPTLTLHSRPSQVRRAWSCTRMVLQIEGRCPWTARDEANRARSSS
eukprot:2121440-Pleurochrysis_carterae.AAC.1